MDRRQQKTRAAIFEAFSRLLEKKHFNNITVQEIIDEANIGRSTFYAHFETKNQLLKELCGDIFSHVFSHELKSEKTHDFSNENGIQSRLTHILYHLKDSSKDITGIFSSESRDIFMQYFKEYLYIMFEEYITEVKVPKDFILNHFVGSFGETVIWWIKNKMQYSPEETASYYMSVINPDIIIKNGSAIKS